MTAEMLNSKFIITFCRVTKARFKLYIQSWKEKIKHMGRSHMATLQSASQPEHWDLTEACNTNDGGNGNKYGDKTFWIKLFTCANKSNPLNN